MKWQDIKTAPHDESLILAWGTNQNGAGPYLWLVVWAPEIEAFVDEDDGYIPVLTHWLPLTTPGDQK
jgi:hypothetical protein